MLENVVDRLVDRLVGWRAGAPAASQPWDPVADRPIENSGIEPQSGPGLSLLSPASIPHFFKLNSGA